MVIFTFSLLACAACIRGLNEVISNARRVVKEAEKVVAAGADVIRLPLQKLLPKWLEKRIKRRVEQRHQQQPHNLPRKLTQHEIRQVEEVLQASVLFLSFLAQWLFWAGFVRTARERYV
jgi:hypothetical protein